MTHTKTAEEIEMPLGLTTDRQANRHTHKLAHYNTSPPLPRAK